MWLVCVQMIILSSKSNHTSNLICIFLYSITTQTLSEKKKNILHRRYPNNKQTNSEILLLFFIFPKKNWNAKSSCHFFTETESCRWSMFGSVVMISFQITFHVEIHVNDVFLFFKNYF
jgi:hypothetical protein